MQTFIQIIEKIKNIKGLTLDYEVADLLGISKKAFAADKKRNSIPFEELSTFCSSGNISLNWLLYDEGPMKIAETRYQENNSSINTYKINEDMQKTYPNSSALTSNDSIVEPSLQAMSDIKEIFDSGDPILIPAIQANLNAFKRALLRERQIAQVLEENKNLISRMAKLEILCKSLKVKVNRLTATYEDPSGDSKDCSNHDSKK
jgi:hypothetical protein